jgi:DNA-binding response OmpR family regulator
MRILLVTSEKLLSELIAFRLELLGHAVDTMTNADEMHRALNESSYALLIMDTRLPDSSARDSLVKIRGRWSRDALPILMISLDQSMELVELAFRCGADDYLLAPFDPETMQGKLERLLLKNGNRA